MTDTPKQNPLVSKVQMDWRNLSICEIGAENSSVLEYMKHWEGRVLKAERELAEARKENASFRQSLMGMHERAEKAEAALARR